MPPLDYGVSKFVQSRMNALRQDPDFWSENAKAIERLCDSAGKESLRRFQANPENAHSISAWPKLPTVHRSACDHCRRGRSARQRLTRYEKGMIERLNAVVLSRIVFPGILRSEWQENYVDQRITSVKEWRDVYGYAPDGTPLGWRRYQSDGIKEYQRGRIAGVESGLAGAVHTGAGRPV